MSDVYGRKFGLCFSGVACTPWKENRTPEEVRGSSLPWDGMQTWLGGSMLLAAKPGGEDFPSGKGVFKACRSLLSHFLSPE